MQHGAGLEAPAKLLAKAAQARLPWHQHIYPHRQGLTEKLKNVYRRLDRTHPGCTGWLLWDEQGIDWAAWRQTVHDHPPHEDSCQRLLLSSGTPSAHDACCGQES